MKDNSWNFEELLKQNEKRLFYQLYRLKLESQEDYYQEGLIALWQASVNYNADKGPLATYFNYSIRYRLIDAIRRGVQESTSYSDVDVSQVAEQRKSYELNPLQTVLQKEFWQQVKQTLTTKEWKWVKYYIIRQ